MAGVRTTYGSPIFADFVPEASDILVQTLEAEGGVDLRQVQYAGVRRRRQHLQRGVRRHANPMEPRAFRRGIVGRGRGRARYGNSMGGAGIRPWAEACAIRPASAVWSASGRAPAASPARPGAKIDRLLSVERPHGAHRGGRRPASRCHDRGEPRRSHLVAQDRKLSGRGTLGVAASAGGLLGRSGHYAGRPGGRRHLPGRGRNVSRSWVPSSRRRIPTCRKPMMPSRFCAG